MAADLVTSGEGAILPQKGKHSPFFADQLTAFQVWLTMGNERRDPPEQLPIVLQGLSGREALYRHPARSGREESQGANQGRRGVWLSLAERLSLTRGSKRLFILKRLKQFNLLTTDLTAVYTTYMRLVLEYAAPVWSSGLTNKQSSQIESIQRRACKIILGKGYTSYADACAQLGLQPLRTRWSQQLCLRFGKKLLNSPFFRSLLPPSRVTEPGSQITSPRPAGTIPGSRPLGSQPGEYCSFSISQALSVGIFPYVLKLLQSSARELRPLLVFIWAKILAVDSHSLGPGGEGSRSRNFVQTRAGCVIPGCDRFTRTCNILHTLGWISVADVDKRS
ncbi:hypothetical protein Bbelb_101570 [Branchiostoma belcheri]|nr:hypothetical protein Bbelb_101570 [Branchiostoma belcheri]